MAPDRNRHAVRKEDNVVKRGLSMSTQSLLTNLREGADMGWRSQASLTMRLGAPAVLAQLSSFAMQFIDASMVGHLGALPSAAVGLMGSSTWLLTGLLTVAAMGFSVQVAHLIGGGRHSEARPLFRQSISAVLLFSVIVALFGASISGHLPVWLGGGDEIAHDSSVYFLVYSLFLPALQMHVLAGCMLRCGGDMKTPSLVSVVMCLMDVILNFFLIFPGRELSISPGVDLYIPGAGLGVLGAALGTGVAELLSGAFLLWYAARRSDMLSLKGIGGRLIPDAAVLRKALRISLPMGGEKIMFCSAYIMLTAIVAPLGVDAIAANALAVTAESLCYMPGFGIGEAATTLVGQAIGAGRRDVARRLAWMNVGLGVTAMTISGAAMYLFAPFIMSLMTNVDSIASLGVMCLRMEAFAEPMYAASIVAYGVFVGAGKTLVPSLMNLGSIWIVRIPLAAWLATQMGLRGVWLAMVFELCFRGVVFLWRLARTSF